MPPATTAFNFREPGEFGDGANCRVAPTDRAQLAHTIIEAKKHHGLTDRELLKRAGVERLALRKARDPLQDPRLSDTIALLNELGYAVTAVPEASRPVIAPSLARALPELRRRLIDLRTSISHARHPDDLRDELDDILYWLEGR